MSNVIVIGGGAAGMMAAYAAALCGHQVKLIEQNEKLGKKIFITGKGRCNITNAGDMDNLFANVMSNPKFLYSAFYTFNNEQMMSFLEEYGLKMKVERGNRVFPVSDHSSDVIATLRKALANKNVEVFLHTKVNHLLVTKEQIEGVGLSDGREVPADAVIVATGGFSYQTTGATGDGYRFAEKTGHKLVQRTPALVPFEIKEAWVKELQGLSLRNVSVSVYNEKKKLYEDFGEMLFTHFGISGPLGLSASSYIGKALEQQPLKGYLNLKPALTEEQLDARILREFEENRNKQFRNVINSLFPAKLLPVMLSLGGIDPYKQVNAVSKAERQHFEELITHFPFTVTGTRGFREAIITQGGVSVKEIRPGTMEAKKKEGLYFVGEVLDLDALTGGFNLQIAWASAHAAAEEIRAKEEQE